MAKNKGQRESFITNWTERQKYVIDDIEHQSKALVPIQIDAGNQVEIVQVGGWRFNCRVARGRGYM